MEEENFISVDDVILINDARVEFSPFEYRKDLERNYLYNILYRLNLFSYGDFKGDLWVFLDEKSDSEPLDRGIIQLVLNVWLDRLKTDYKVEGVRQLRDVINRDDDQFVITLFSSPGIKLLMEKIVHVDNVFQQCIEEHLALIEKKDDKELQRQIDRMKEQMNDNDREEQNHLLNSINVLRDRFYNNFNELSEHVESFRYEFFNAMLFKYAFGFNVIVDMTESIKAWKATPNKKWNFFDFSYVNPVLFRGYFPKGIAFVKKDFMKMWDIIKALDEDSMLCEALVEDAITMIFRSILITKTIQYKEERNLLTEYLKDLYSHTMKTHGNEIRAEAKDEQNDGRVKFIDEYKMKTEKKPRLNESDLLEMKDIIKVGITKAKKERNQEEVNQIFN